MNTNAALPWYRSPVYISQIVTIVSTLTALFPKAASLLGLSTPESVQTTIEALFTIIALGSGVVGEVKRRNSVVQPITLTQAAADDHPVTVAAVAAANQTLAAATNTPPSGVKK